MDIDGDGGTNFALFSQNLKIIYIKNYKKFTQKNVLLKYYVLETFVSGKT